MKLGLDIHGVIDTHPDEYVALAQAVLDAGGEVHILTGELDTPKLRQQLKSFGIKYTTLFSISTYHLGKGTAIRYDEKGDPHMDEILWDRTKADYCIEHGIDLHIDDTERYGKYFKTPFLLIKGKQYGEHSSKNSNSTTDCELVA